MAQTTEKAARVSPFKLVRGVRDVAMDAWARVVLGVTSSGAYSRTSAMVTRPGLVALGLVRGKSEQLMSRLLSELNMPSRADVLSLSIRLTHIETAIDDLAAVVDELRASVARPTAARRGSSNGHDARAPQEPRP